MSTLDSIRSAADDYSNSISETRVYKSQWKTRTLPTLVTIFNNITQKVDLDWFIEQSDVNQPFQNIRLGLLRETLNSQAQSQEQPEMQNGGCLNYKQLFNGKIVAEIVYPTVDGVRNVESHELGEFKPQDVTDELITQHIYGFLIEMTRWQRREPERETSTLI